MTELLAEVRALGIAMGSKHQGHYFGFTTNEQAAEAARTAGASVIGCYNRIGPRGWEVAIPDASTEATK
jgi:hypothetical protein